jgi:hypothetical protein
LPGRCRSRSQARSANRHDRGVLLVVQLVPSWAATSDVEASGKAIVAANCEVSPAAPKVVTGDAIGLPQLASLVGDGWNA